ncbi:MAG TPA: metallophosphoesterase [Alphaproteobacteria bacterium]|nr:metallophosphoesterase [Alphaproteobacteria bacterium]
MADASGLLFIGDPHISARRPGRRTDPDFAATSLDKLEQALAIAAANGLWPVILGDLFDRAREDDHTVIVRTLRLLKAAPRRPFCLVGNHDRLHDRLSDDTALGLLAETGALHVIAESGPAASLELAGRRIGLGGTPHGQDIPDSVDGLFPEAEAVVWLTHHDLAFGRPYPGAQPLRPIAGAALAVNGHMHGREAARPVGGTVWHNPGNILRQSVDLRDHVPAVWSWRPGGPAELVEHRLRFTPDRFDLTGRLAQPISSGRSVFADLLKAESQSEMGRSADGAMLLEDIERLFDQERTGADVQAILRDLHARAVARG